MALMKRKWTALFLIIIIPAGFYSKFYSGPLAGWVNNSLGGILYIIFWSLLVFLFLPKVKVIKIALFVSCITVLLEFLQLWPPPFLEMIRGHFLGRTLLGHSFSWWDIFHYGIGFVLSLLLLQYVKKIETNKAS